MSSAEASSQAARSVRRAGASASPISPAMLRHFAVLTIVITACIAIFAEGEQGQAEAAKVQKPDESTSAISAMMGGAEEAALKQAREGKATKEVNGLRLGSGTRLSDNASSGDEGSQQFYQPAATGDVRYSNPDQHVMLDADGRLPDAAPAATVGWQPPPMVKDSKGVPAPSVKPPNSKQQAAAKQPPRRATQQDFDRMMEASAARSGKATVDEQD